MFEDFNSLENRMLILDIVEFDLENKIYKKLGLISMGTLNQNDRQFLVYSQTGRKIYIITNKDDLKKSFSLVSSTVTLRFDVKSVKYVMNKIMLVTEFDKDGGEFGAIVYYLVHPMGKMLEEGVFYTI